MDKTTTIMGELERCKECIGDIEKTLTEIKGTCLHYNILIVKERILLNTVWH